MHKEISRRDFLKLAGIFPLSLAAPRLLDQVDRQAELQNVIVIVFDALSAYDLSLLGYPRETIPNLSRLADRAVVYHNHYAGGNFTVPGTATLLTGTLPWTHRAFNHGGLVDEPFVKRSFFTAFADYYRLTYSHNPRADGILRQYRKSLDDYVPRSRLFLRDDSIVPTTLFKNDDDIATVSWLRAVKDREDGFAYSLYFPHLLDVVEEYQDRKLVALQTQFPTGLPKVFSGSYYMLEDATEWFGDRINGLPHPFFCYLHFMPPHAPYKTHRDFHGRFSNDGWLPETKPLDMFFEVENEKKVFERRTSYDEFILYADREFGRLFDYLEKSGLLDNTWVILTSDHGEMFERGITGHTTPVLYEPVIRIPLMIFEPGRRTRLDVHSPTSAVDVLPTLLHVTGQRPADWVEGMVLPPYSSTYQGNDRSIYVLEAKKNEKYAPMRIATTAMIRGGYKLMSLFGYPELGGDSRVELYDVQNDPDEMADLYSVKRETAAEMLHELEAKLAEVNEPYL